MHDLGLALSGGGSRAAAFHCGTLSALRELGLTDQIGVVSTVSGGSLFGAAWMAARARGADDDAFVDAMKSALEAGFVRRALCLWPRRKLTWRQTYTRAHALADAFDGALLDGLTLGKLPDVPALCVNATILNNGQVAKFDRHGFSAWGIQVPASNPSHLVPMRTLPLSHAVVASASFPIGLPPFVLDIKTFPSGTSCPPSFTKPGSIYLSDGGVLENLGVQTLLRSRRFGSWDIIQSDAGALGSDWLGPVYRDRVKSVLIGLLGGWSLQRVMGLMGDKQARWARSEIFDAQGRSWLIDEVRKRQHQGLNLSRELRDFLGPSPICKRRRIMFVGLGQTWSNFFKRIPRWRLIELAAQAGQAPRSIPPRGDPSAVVAYLESLGCDLSAARRHHCQMGGDRVVSCLKKVKTSFCALPRDTVRRLAEQAAWQVHATYAVYYADAR